MLFPRGRLLSTLLILAISLSRMCACSAMAMPMEPQAVAEAHSCCKTESPAPAKAPAEKDDCPHCQQHQAAAQNVSGERTDLSLLKCSLNDLLPPVETAVTVLSSDRPSQEIWQRPILRVGGDLYHCACQFLN